LVKVSQRSDSDLGAQTMNRNHSPAVAPPAAPEAPTTGPESAGLLETLLAGAPSAGESPGTALQALSGHLAGIDADGRVLFRAEGAAEAVPVGIAMEISDGALVRAARSGRRAFVLRTADARPRWLLTGLVRERVSAKARDAGPGQLEVKVDGETVRLEAQQQIELSCGKSSLLLRADGRVVLSGVYVVTKSNGPLKIKGATIALN
jgi:hypothetical protein